MIKVTNKTLCTGCAACQAVCPVNAIKMVEDEEGFRYPVTDKSKCINCGNCDRTCPVLNFDSNRSLECNAISTHAYRSDSSERAESSSGGVFFDLCNYFIRNNGAVVGAAFTEDYHLKHFIIEKLDEINELMGSKYLQSDISGVYIRLKNILSSGRKVLFIGTSCQVEGIHAYLKKSYDNLFCVDLIDMGVPSPLVWDRYLDTFYDRNTIKKINYKDKKLGWHKFSVAIHFDDGSCISEEGFDNYFMESMFKGYSIRPSCFECKFKCQSKLSDCTIADCWGIENYLKELDDNKGTSMIITHTEKGERLLEIIKETGVLKSFEYENVLKYNHYYYQSKEHVRGRKLYYRLLKTHPRLTFKLYGKNPNKTLIHKLRQKCSSLKYKICKAAGA